MRKRKGPRPLQADGTYDLPLWLKKVTEHRSPTETLLITKACDLAEKKGSDPQLPFNVSYFYQSLSIADILHHLGLDAECLAAGLLYKAFQQAKITEADIIQTFNLDEGNVPPGDAVGPGNTGGPQGLENSGTGMGVLRLLQGVQKMHGLPMDRQLQQIDRQLQQTENLRRLLLAVVEDVRVVMIKLAEFTADMRQAITIEETLKHRYAIDAQEIYAPLANRLGVGQIKWELEDLAFRFMEPQSYKHIAQFLHGRREDREIFINQVVNEIETALKEHGIKASVKGRAKHIYSIWKKMQRKGVSYQEIYDVHAIRILVSSISECYSVLGVIHSLWHHIPKEFDDYIANPKNNDYRSLHTAVFGPQGKTLEIQIRTKEMNSQAELGIAAHWRYKEGGQSDVGYEAKLANLRQVLKWQEEWPSDTAAAEALRTEVFQDRVYVLTPKGEVLDLPLGATVLDFAYHIHTEVGNRCRGAKINGRITPLTTALKSGDQVEIITLKNGAPSRDWLNPQFGYLKTLRARTKVHQWFKRQDRDQNIQDGREVLDRELQRLGVENIHFETLASKLKFNKAEDMFAAIGNGDIRVMQVLSAMPLQLKKAPEKKTIRLRPTKKLGSTDVIVAGIGNLYCQIARCCKPVPGEEIIGYIAAGRGVSVHRKDCVNILLAKERQLSRLIQVEWQGEVENQYVVDVVISAFDRQGLLRDISAIMAGEHMNVVDISLRHKDDNTIDVRVSLEVSGIEQLSSLFKRLQHLPNIISVRRLQQS